MFFFICNMEESTKCFRTWMWTYANMWNKLRWQSRRKWSSNEIYLSKQVYLYFTIFAIINLFLCISLLEMINGCPPSVWLLGNSVLLRNHSFWFCKGYAQAPKRSPPFQIPINLLLNYCCFYCVFAWFQTLCSTVCLRFGLWIFSLDAYFWLLGTGLCAQSDHPWFRCTFCFQTAKIYTLWF